MQQSAHDQSKPSAGIQSAAAFRGVEKAFKDAQTKQKEDLRQQVADLRHNQVKKMINEKITDTAWNELIRRAHKAAEGGQKQFTLLHFPSEVCSDDGRAINNPPNPAWPETLRGQAADIYARWNTTLRPLGFNLSAQVLDFPGGKPGDVGLFLRWGENP